MKHIFEQLSRELQLRFSLLLPLRATTSDFISKQTPSICLRPLEKNKHISSSDRFPLKPTGENTTYSLANGRLPCEVLGISHDTGNSHLFFNSSIDSFSLSTSAALLARSATLPKLELLELLERFLTRPRERVTHILSCCNAPPPPPQNCFNFFRVSTENPT